MRHIWIMLILASGIAVTGCSKSFYGGAAVGTGVAGIAYEAYNKDKLDDLEEDYERGRIDRDEYERRRNEIRDRSLVY